MEKDQSFLDSSDCTLYIHTNVLWVSIGMNELKWRIYILYSFCRTSHAHSNSTAAQERKLYQENPNLNSDIYTFYVHCTYAEIVVGWRCAFYSSWLTNNQNIKRTLYCFLLTPFSFGVCVNRYIPQYLIYT